MISSAQVLDQHSSHSFQPTRRPTIKNSPATVTCVLAGLGWAGLGWAGLEELAPVEQTRPHLAARWPSSPNCPAWAFPLLNDRVRSRPGFVP
jgi:hypothetical protein